MINSINTPYPYVCVCVCCLSILVLSFLSLHEMYSIILQHIFFLSLFPSENCGSIEKLKQKKEKLRICAIGRWVKWFIFPRISNCIWFWFAWKLHATHHVHICNAHNIYTKPWYIFVLFYFHAKWKCITLKKKKRTYQEMYVS